MKLTKATMSVSRTIHRRGGSLSTVLVELTATISINELVNLQEQVLEQVRALANKERKEA